MGEKELQELQAANDQKAEEDAALQAANGQSTLDLGVEDYQGEEREVIECFDLCDEVACLEDYISWTFFLSVKEKEQQKTVCGTCVNVQMISKYYNVFTFLYFLYYIGLETEEEGILVRKS